MSSNYDADGSVVNIGGDMMGGNDYIHQLQR